MRKRSSKIAHAFAKQSPFHKVVLACFKAEKCSSNGAFHYALDFLDYALTELNKSFLDDNPYLHICVLQSADYIWRCHGPSFLHWLQGDNVKWETLGQPPVIMHWIWINFFSQTLTFDEFKLVVDTLDRGGNPHRIFEPKKGSKKILSLLSGSQALLKYAKH